MTMLSRPDAIATPERPVLHTLDNALPLEGNDPVDVYVRISGGVPEFSTDQQLWYPDIGWKCITAKSIEAYALFITYHLPIDGTELQPVPTALQTLWFSPVITQTIEGGSTTRTQLGYLPCVAAKTTFSFNVGLGETVLDPEIVITPIGGGGTGDGGGGTDQE